MLFTACTCQTLVTAQQKWQLNLVGSGSQAEVMSQINYLLRFTDCFEGFPNTSIRHVTCISLIFGSTSGLFWF